MPSVNLEVISVPKLQQGVLLLALTGWMDGGAVSTGTVRNIMDGRTLEQVARINPDPFYIYNFPGSMEVTALFRPRVVIEKGLIRELDVPTGTFLCDPSSNLVFFVGKEPNLRWQSFSDSIFDFVHQAGIVRIIFMGSFGGAVPHTREPRMFASVSHKRLIPMIEPYGARLSDYDGPAGFSTFLLAEATRHNVEMIAFVAEIPGYLQGVNPLSIEAVTRRLAKILNIPVDMDAMRETSNAWETQVTEAIQQDKQLADTVKKLEEAYDSELVQEQEEADEKKP